MSEPATDEFAWVNDPSLDDEARWAAFKAWEARKRREYAQSEQAREDFRAWVESKPDWRIESVATVVDRRRKVFRIT